MPTFPTEPDGFPYHLWYRLARRQLPASAEVPASAPERRAWVGVYPLPEAGGCFIKRYEILAERYDEICATWDYDEPGMLLDMQDVTVPDDVQLLEVLRSWIGDLSLLKDLSLSGAPV